MLNRTKEADLRAALIESALSLERQNVNQGTSGNLSARCGEVMLITPSAVPYDRLTSKMITKMPIKGEYGAWSGPLPPSSEWRIHLDILRAKPEVGAVIHTHALYATTLSLMHKVIPAVHYMVAAFGGPTIRCTRYAPFGTKELSDLTLEGLTDRHGVLLGQHGMVVTGENLGQALWRAVELETLAKMYLLALSVGEPAVLTKEEVMRTVERFKNYGYQAVQGIAEEQSAKESRQRPLAKHAPKKTSRRAVADKKPKKPRPRR